MADSLSRIERIIKEAESLPRIDLPPDGWSPSKDELTTKFAQLAMGYATSTALLQQALPIIIEEIHALRDELRLRDRRAKSLKRVR